jgi:hypothetical protein
MNHSAVVKSQAVVRKKFSVSVRSLGVIDGRGLGDAPALFDHGDVQRMQREPTGGTARLGRITRVSASGTATFPKLQTMKPTATGLHVVRLISHLEEYADLCHRQLLGERIPHLIHTYRVHQSVPRLMVAFPAQEGSDSG